MIKAIVVDDEKNGRENLIGVLERYCPEVEVVAEASSAIDAIHLIEQDKPSLVFLDIEMPGGNGFEVLNHFDRPDFQVIFVTAYDHYAIQAIRFSALDYILKPIDAVELKNAIKRYLSGQPGAPDHRLDVFKSNHHAGLEEKKIAVAFSDKIDFIKVKRIIKCKGEGSYTIVYLDDNTELLTSRPLIDYEELLEGFGFIRTHKAYIINIAHVASYVKRDGGYLEMSDRSSVPISRRKRDEVLSRLK